jgi:hypothetical protein
MMTAPVQDGKIGVGVRAYAKTLSVPHIVIADGVSRSGIFIRKLAEVPARSSRFGGDDIV